MRSATFSSAAFVTLAVAVLWTSPGRAQSTTPRPAPSSEPDRAWLGAETCAATPPREIGRSPVRNLRLVLASQPPGPHADSGLGHRGSTLAAWSMSEGSFATRAIGAELGETHEVALDQGINVSVLAPASGGRFIAVTTGFLCPGRVRGAACVRAIGLAADGAATGPAYAPEPRDQETSVVSRTILRDASGTPTGVAVAFQSRWSFHDIVLFRLDPAGQIVAEAHPIHVESSGAGPISRIVAAGEQVVAFGSESEWDDASDREIVRPHVIALGSRRQAVPSFAPAEAEIVYARLDGPVMDVVVRAPRLQPRWARISTLDGSLVVPVATLTRGAPTPGTPVFPRLRAVRGRLSFERLDLRGELVGAPLDLGPAAGPVVSAWSWEGESLHLAWGVRRGREWIVSEAHLSCARAASP
jgi:hypothetical protein